MIGYLIGKLIDSDSGVLTLDVAGVGYEVNATAEGVALALSSPEKIALWIHMVVREDAMQLYGFQTKQERSVYRELIKISGVGPKVALSILSGLSLSDLVRSVNMGDVSALTAVPGIGKKTAERLLIELRDRLKAMGDLDMELSAPSMPKASDNGREAEAALIALGYRPVEAAKMIASVATDIQGGSVEDIIREALKRQI